MRRRATLPHPIGCSTIAVPGLSFQVRNGDWASPRGHGHRKTLILRLSVAVLGTGRRTRYALLHADRSRPSAPRRHDWDCFSMVWTVKNDCIILRRLVPVSSTPRGASTSGLSTRCSSGRLTTIECDGVLILRRASRLDAFSGYPIRM